MEVPPARCAGLDGPRASVLACARLVVAADGATTVELERLAAWRAARAVSHAAREATGVSWKPVDALDHALDHALDALDAASGDGLGPFRAAAARLTTIPGVGALAAAGILVAEIGCGMSRFATPAHRISWAGLCPKSDEGAGKRRSTRLRQGAPWLKTLLVQVAWSAARAKAGYLPALFARLRARRGPKKAITAVAAAILTAVSWRLRRGTGYQDRGADSFERTDRQRLATKLTRKLDHLGVTATPAQRQPA